MAALPLSAVYSQNGWDGVDKQHPGWSGDLVESVRYDRNERQMAYKEQYLSGDAPHYTSRKNQRQMLERPGYSQNGWGILDGTS